jgi:hypothetical protein
MSSLPVLAEASSKLHADIAIIRLRRAGIHSDRISAVFPQGRAPNSVCCSLNGFYRVPMPAPAPIAAAGLLGELFRKGVNAADFDEQLESLGLTSDLAHRLIEKMEDGRMILCVHARNESEAAIAWRVFNQVAAENIVCPTGFVDAVQHEAPALTPQLSGIAA